MNSGLNTPIRALICDDHQIFCAGIKEIIKHHLPSLEVLICNDLTTCQSLLDQFAIDIFICDIHIHQENGLSFIEKNQHKLQNKNIIILSGYTEDYMIRKARKIGVNYFLKKEVGVDELIMAIKMEHSNYLPTKNTSAPAIKTQGPLSKQEREILKLIVAGKLSKEIADILNISKTTVDTHRRNIHRKLNTSSSTELLKMVYEGRI